MHDFGVTMRARREAAGLSLRALARAAHVDPGHLSRVEAGRRPATGTLAKTIDRILEAGGELEVLAGRAAGPGWSIGPRTWQNDDRDALADVLVDTRPTPANAVELAHQWLITEPVQLREMRAGRRIGTSTVQRVERRVHQLRLLDDHVGGASTFPLLTAEIAATSDLLRLSTYSEAVGRRLLVALGELGQVGGWVASDHGRHADAERLYLAGMRAAHAGGDRAGAANCLSSLSYQVANTGDPRTAVTLARSAYCGAQGHASATTLALLGERVAWANARAGDDVACERALSDVDGAYERRRPDDDPVWVYWLDPGEIEVMAGRCWTELQRPLRAVPILERATARYGDDVARETALYLSWLADALVQAREVDRAAAISLDVLRLNDRSGSARVDHRVRALWQALQPHGGNSVVNVFLKEAATRSARPRR